jgi:putative oxidoreductase
MTVRTLDAQPEPTMPLSLLTQAHRHLVELLDRLQPLFLLAVRWYVSWQFLKSGALKIGSWQTTLGLFETEYHVPLLPPHLAALVGTFGELCFPVLLVLGLGGRIGALGLSAVNAMAVISYAHVLFADGLEAALAQHVLWGFMLGVLVFFGNGGIGLDRLFGKR